MTDPRPLPVVPPPTPRELGRPSAAARANGRACGDCRECCTVLGVDAVFKAPGTPCPHLCERGCGIYASRPEECAVYRCLWHIGVIGETRDRPDRLGVVFDVPADMEEQPLWRGIRFLVAREARPGAASSKRARAIIGTMAKVAVVLVEPFGRQVERMHGPESLMAEVRRRALDPGIKSSRPQAQE